MENFVLELWGNPLPPLTNVGMLGNCSLTELINRINTELIQIN